MLQIKAERPETLKAMVLKSNKFNQLLFALE
jgi:hypothetical protein